MSLRQEKVSTALKREISNIIHEELKDQRIGFVTIMRVDLTKDLRSARVYFSVLGEEKQRIATQKALENAKGFMRRLIAQKLNLRFAPEIIFKLDKSCEYSIRIQQELDKIKEDERKRSY